MSRKSKTVTDAAVETAVETESPTVAVNRRLDGVKHLAGEHRVRANIAAGVYVGDRSAWLEDDIAALEREAAAIAADGRS